MKRLILLASYIFLLASPVWSQDTNYVRQVLRRLTSEEFHGRGYSYHGDSIAASFLRNELKRLGVKPMGDNYYQPYTMSIHSMEGPLSLEINGVELQPYTQYRVPSWSKSTWGEFKVITIPADILGDSDKLKKFLKKNNDLLQEVFVYVEESKGTQAALLAELPIRNPFNSRGVILGRKELSTYSPAHADIEHGYAYIEVLSSAMPQEITTLRCNIFTQFHPRYQTQNVCGYIQGEVDTMIVFTAHYDHLGTMGDNITFYGAHDNGSGVASVLDLARMAVREKPHYTHVFYFFSGEEAGLLGSRYAVEHPLFDFSKVRLLVNIDMFCGGDEGIMIFNAKTPETEPFFSRLETLNNALAIAPEIRPRENRPNSDHFFFSQHMPAIFILSMGQPFGGYHDPYDTCDACGLANYMNYITLISSLAY